MLHSDLQAVDFLSGMGLGIVADQLKELKLGELLETPPPGLDEAVAISKVVQFVNSQVGLDGGCTFWGWVMRGWGRHEYPGAGRCPCCIGIPCGTSQHECYGL